MGHHHHSLLHFPSFGKKDSATSMVPMVPKGWMAIRVGEEQQRFVVPVVYLNHPLFVGLLKEAEEEYGFEHKGAITIPCHVEYFRHVQGIIDSDINREVQPHHHHHGHHHFHLGGCFGGGLKV